MEHNIPEMKMSMISWGNEISRGKEFGCKKGR